MSNHIPAHRLLPQDMVIIYDHGPEHEPFKTPVAHTMHAVDAKHSMGTDPKRWALDPRPHLVVVEKEVHDGE